MIGRSAAANCPRCAPQSVPSDRSRAAAQEPKPAGAATMRIPLALHIGITGAVRMGGRAVEGAGHENRQAREGLVGSNPTPSANRNDQASQKKSGENVTFACLAL